MYRLICILALILIPWHCVADTPLFWVLGSYAVEANAKDEQLRLSELLDAKVIVKQAANGMYRVMVNTSEVNDDSITSSSPGAWQLPVWDRQVNTGAKANPEFVAETEAVTNSVSRTSRPVEKTLATVEEKIAEKERMLAVPEIEEGESFIQYCARVPEAFLCRYPATQSFLERQRTVAAEKAALVNWCNGLADKEAKSICQWLQDE